VVSTISDGVVTVVVSTIVESVPIAVVSVEAAGEQEVNNAPSAKTTTKSPFFILNRFF